MPTRFCKVIEIAAQNDLGAFQDTTQEGFVMGQLASKLPNAVHMRIDLAAKNSFGWRQRVDRILELDVADEHHVDIALGDLLAACDRAVHEGELDAIGYRREHLA